MTFARLRNWKPLLLLAVTWGLQSHAADPAGKIVKLKGSVMIEAGKSKKAAAEGDKFFVGDTFVTGADGRAKLQFAEGGPAGKNEVVIASSSRLLIEKAGSAASGKTGTSLALTEGSIRSTVNRKYSGEGDDVFKVRTPNAVAGVRGTIFLMNFDKSTQSSTLLTQRGKVEFAMGASKVFVGAGQVVMGNKGGEVGKVQNAEGAKNLPGSFKEIEKSEGDGGKTPAGESDSSAKNNSGGHEAPPPAMDHEKVETKTADAGATGGDASGSPAASNNSSGSSSSSSTTSSNSSSGSSGTSSGSGTAANSGSRGPAPASTAPAGSTAGTPPPPGPAPASPPPTGVISNVVTAPPPPPPPIFAPPPVYVPPIPPTTISQTKNASGTGTVNLKIGNQ